MLIRTQILLPQDILNFLRSAAARQNKSVSELVRSIVSEKLTLPKRKSALKTMKEMAKSAYKGNVPKNFSTDDDLIYKQ